METSEKGSSAILWTLHLALNAFTYVCVTIKTPEMRKPPYSVKWAGSPVSAAPSTSLVPHPRTPPSKKRSGERSQLSWAYFLNVIMTNEIAKSVIIT